MSYQIRIGETISRLGAGDEVEVTLRNGMRVIIPARARIDAAFAAQIEGVEETPPPVDPDAALSPATAADIAAVTAEVAAAYRTQQRDQAAQAAMAWMQERMRANGKRLSPAQTARLQTAALAVTGAPAAGEVTL